MKYTLEHIVFIKENVKGIQYKELTERFNKRFNTNLSTSTLVSTVKRYGYKNGIDARFRKGHKPYNKGIKGVGGWKPTQFKKGSTPANYRPVGSERINKDGYIEVKIGDPSTWRPKHIYVWEKANNKKLPKHHAIVFLDRNKLNCNIENLRLVHRRELLILNKNKMLNDDIESNKCCINLAKIESKIKEREVKNEK